MMILRPTRGRGSQASSASTRRTWPSGPPRVRTALRADPHGASDRSNWPSRRTNEGSGMKKPDGRYIAIGMAIGVAIGTATHNLAVWIAIGVAIGLALSQAR